MLLVYVNISHAAIRLILRHQTAPLATDSNLESFNIFLLTTQAFLPVYNNIVLCNMTLAQPAPCLCNGKKWALSRHIAFNTILKDQTVTTYHKATSAPLVHRWVGSTEYFLYLPTLLHNGVRYKCCLIINFVNRMQLSTIKILRYKGKFILLNTIHLKCLTRIFKVLCAWYHNGYNVTVSNI